MKPSIRISLLLFLLLLAGLKVNAQNQKWYIIPTQELNLYQMIGDESKKPAITVKEFEISQQVTLKEYKDYLNAVKKDSSETFYRSQLPDTSIGSADVRAKYLNDKQYENFPVLGISWEDAMNYCKWKTMSTQKDSIKVLYRLPHCSEWLAAYSYLQTSKTKHDFNVNYSDWSINTFDESFYDFMKRQDPQLFLFDWVHLHVKKDARVLKRKRVMGNSYLYQQNHRFMDASSFYANEGYKQIGFRCVIVPIIPVAENQNGKNLNTTLLEYWGIQKK